MSFISKTKEIIHDPVSIDLGISVVGVFAAAALLVTGAPMAAACASVAGTGGLVRAILDSQPRQEPG